MKRSIVSKFLIGLVCLAGLAPVRAAGKPFDIHIDAQYLTNCIVLDQKSIIFDDNLVILDANLVVKKLTGECGCKSASVAYSSYVEYDMGEGKMTKDVLQAGSINTMQSGRKKLVLSSGGPLPIKKRMTVALTCDRDL